MLPVGKSDRITAMLAVAEFTDDNFLLMLTDDGLIKKTPMSRLLKLRATGLSVIKLEVPSYTRKHQLLVVRQYDRNVGICVLLL